ncbi:MAG: FHA domain-containing protein [Actinomycetia bacterium]|nr:FHA domain-containing protein [Actinomycetes bacterium]
MAIYRANYVPGNWVVVAGPNLLVLLEPDLKRAGPKLERIWTDVQTATALDELVASLVQWGPEASAAAVFQMSPGKVRLTYRGQANVLDANSGAVVADGAGSPIWRTVEPTTAHIQVNLGIDTFGVQRVPLLLGMVGVSGFTVDAREGAATPKDRAGKPVEPAPATPETDSDVLDRFGLGGLLGIAQPLDGWEVPSFRPASATASLAANGLPTAEASFATPGIDAPEAPAETAPPGTGLPRPAVAPALGTQALPETPAWPNLDGLSLVDPTPLAPTTPEADWPATETTEQPTVTAEEAAWMAAMDALSPKTRPAAPPAEPAVGSAWMTRAFPPGRPVTPPVGNATPVPTHDADPFGALGGLRPVPPSAVSTPDTVAPTPPAEDHSYTASDIEAATARLLEQLSQPLTADWVEPAPATPPAPDPVPDPPTPAARLSFGPNMSVPIDGAVVIGRAPQSPPQERARLVKVNSPSHGLSRSHVRIEPAGGGFRVSDLHSTNGTVVQRPDEQPVPIEAGVPVIVPVGTVLELGGAVQAQIVAA